MNPAILLLKIDPIFHRRWSVYIASPQSHFALLHVVRENNRQQELFQSHHPLTPIQQCTMGAWWSRRVWSSIYCTLRQKALDKLSTTACQAMGSKLQEKQFWRLYWYPCNCELWVDLHGTKTITLTSSAFFVVFPSHFLYNKQCFPLELFSGCYE